MGGQTMLGTWAARAQVGPEEGRADGKSAATPDTLNLNHPCEAKPGRRRIPRDPDHLPGLVGSAQSGWPWTSSEPDCHAGEGGC